MSLSVVVRIECDYPECGETVMVDGELKLQGRHLLIAKPFELPREWTKYETDGHFCPDHIKTGPEHYSYR